MTRAAVLALVLLCACASAAPLADVDAVRRAALVDGNVAALRTLFADGMRYGHTNGQVHTKDEMLSLLASGSIDYRAIHVETSETREIAGALVVTGRQTVEASAEGRAVTSRSIFTAVYAREGGRWRLIAYQSAPAAP